MPEDTHTERTKNPFNHLSKDESTAETRAVTAAHPATGSFDTVREARLVEQRIRCTFAPIRSASLAKGVFLATLSRLSDAEQAMRLTHIVTRVTRTLSYDPDSGRISWALCPSSAAYTGDEAGREREKHSVINLDGRRHLACDVAYMLINGTYPICDVRHRDGDPMNNRAANLYLADPSVCGYHQSYVKRRRR